MPGSAKVCGAWKVPSPLPSNTERVFSFTLATARSSLPSPLKSPTVTPAGPLPTVKLGAGMKVPLPLPSSTEAVPESTLETARSGLPSPLKSPTATSPGWVPTGKVFGAWKVPSPLPSNTQAVQSPKLTTARSGFPSPLKSATAMPEGPFLAPAAYSVWGLNNGVCANVGFGNANRKNEVAATNNDNLPNSLFTEHLASELQRHPRPPREQPMSRSASRTKLTGHSAENSCSCLTFFFAPTLREGPIENQLVEHLHSLSRESLPRILSSP